MNIKKSINVEASQQRAFRVFTEGMGRWWPQQHHIGKAALERMVVEPRVGGGVVTNHSIVEWNDVLD